MADGIVATGAGDKRLRDMGDGTVAEVVAGTSLPYTASATRTRPANTTPYAANAVISDATGAAYEFTNIGPAGGHVLLTRVSLRIDIGAVPSGMAGFKLRLFNAAPANQADGAAYDLAAADRAKWLGDFAIQTPTSATSTLTAESEPGATKQVKLANGATSLWARITTDAGYTPNSGSVYTIGLSSLSLP